MVSCNCYLTITASPAERPLIISASVALIIPVSISRSVFSPFSYIWTYFLSPSFFIRVFGITTAFSDLAVTLRISAIFPRYPKAGFSSVNVGQITAIGEDVRLYTREGIYNAAVTASEMKQGNIHGHNLIAYGGTKDIGAQNKPLGVTLSGDLLEAYADGSIYIKNMTGTDRLRVGSLFAKNLISLESKPGFDMTTNPKYTLAYLNAGNVLELKTDENEGIVGREENPIRILNNGTLVNLKAKEGYVKGMNGLLGANSTMKLGLIETAGNFTAVSESNLEAGATQLEEKDAQGNVIKPSITGEIHSGGNVKLEAATDAVVSGPVLSTNGDILIKAAADASINEAVTATAGNVAVEAANLAKIKGSLEVKGAGKKVSVSGVKGIVLDGSVTAGLPYQNSDGRYTGGELIELVSAGGAITQNPDSALTAPAGTRLRLSVQITGSEIMRPLAQIKKKPMNRAKRLR